MNICSYGKMRTQDMKAYWFSDICGLTMHMRYHKIRPAKIGRVDSVEGELVPCKNGLHSSPTPWDALQYADGSVLWEVEIGDEMVPHGDPVDKYASRTRKYIKCIDLSKAIRIFAAKQALSVSHLWVMPIIVKAYLGDSAAGIDREDIQAAARDAARNAVCSARDAAWAASWADAFDTKVAAARYVAWAAARAASWATAFDTAGTDAWDTACDAAWAAAFDTAGTDAWDAACDAVRDASWDAARAASWDAVRDQFNEIAISALNAS